MERLGLEAIIPAEFLLSNNYLSCERVQKELVGVFGCYGKCPSRSSFRQDLRRSRTPELYCSRDETNRQQASFFDDLPLVGSLFFFYDLVT